MSGRAGWFPTGLSQYVHFFQESSTFSRILNHSFVTLSPFLNNSRIDLSCVQVFDGGIDSGISSHDINIHPDVCKKMVAVEIVFSLKSGSC